MTDLPTPDEHWPMLDTEPADEAPRSPRPWRDKFRDALRGWKFGIRGHSSFFVHFFFAALVFVAAVVLRCSVVEWGLLLLSIGLVLTAELFNSAIETLFRGLPSGIRERSWKSLDIAAGAVLMASVFAALVGLVVFGNRIVELWRTP